MQALWPLSIRTRLTLWYSAALLVILILIALAGHTILGRSLMQDLDASLLTVAQVLVDTTQSGESSDVDALLRELLGPDFYDKFFQLLDPEGRPEPWASPQRPEALRLSPQARANAARGVRTF